MKNLCKKWFPIIKKYVCAFIEKHGRKFTIGLVIYSLFLCFLSIKLDRMYLSWQLDRVFKNKQNNSISSNKIKKHKLFAPKPINIKSNEVLTIDNNFEIIIKGFEFTKKLKPKKIKELSFYNYYEPKDSNNLYIDITMDIKNIEANEIELEDVIQEFNAIYDKKYNYDGFAVMEYLDESDFETYMSKIKPLQTRVIHLLIEVPKVSKEDDKPIDFNFKIADQDYILQIK